ncbi:MAG TPA: molybdopterin cofactor-binding domain-containing protein [Acidimicrobiales bacterium]|nr:molybdopterin cofactor-binding domain-containing protein [Acidimicrobiales bacterium]
MSEHPVTDRSSESGAAGLTPRGHSRRRFLGYLVAAPVLVTAAQLGSKLPADANSLNLTGPASGTAGSTTAMTPVPSPDQLADITDLGDLLILAMAPTSPMIKVTVHRDGSVHFNMPREENGQGISTGVAMLIADEMDVALSAVHVTLADAEPSLLFNQITGGSSTIRTLYTPVRTAAAAARQQMVATAASQWGVPAGSLSVADGVVHGPGGRRATYGQLTSLAAATTTTPVQVTPKDPSEYKLVGNRVPQRSARDIITGKQLYATDLDIAGAKPTMVRRAPVQKGKLVALHNRRAIEVMPGVLDVAEMPFGVAIRGETFGQVIDAVNAVEAAWGPGPVSGELDDKAIFDRLKAAAVPLAVPDLPKLPVGDVRTIDMEFQWAYVNHAPLEPNVSIADVRPDRAEIWSPLQNPIVLLQEVAKATGLPQNAVTVHVTRGGGSFGRTLWFDAALESAQISKTMGKPVKLMWHRTNDMRQSRGHPPTYHRLRATVAGGSVLSYEQRVSAVQTAINPGLGEAMSYASYKAPGGELGYDMTLFNTTVTCPYNFGAVTEVLDEVDIRLWTSSWRSVYSYDTRCSEEIMVDQIAKTMGQDPLTFRLAFLKDQRIKNLLSKVAEVGQWGRPMKPGTAQGLCANSRDRGFGASLVEVDATDPAKPRVTKAVIAVDAVVPINPMSIEAQQLGGLSDAIGLVFTAGNPISNGLPVPDGWDQFGVTRQGQYPPEVQVFVVPRDGDNPAGIGESGVPNTAGAIANAYIRATGRMPTSFPINPVAISDTTPAGQIGTQDSDPIPTSFRFDY